LKSLIRNWDRDELGAIEAVRMLMYVIFGTIAVPYNFGFNTSIAVSWLLLAIVGFGVTAFFVETGVSRAKSMVSRRTANEAP
jgi:hypothetical protein